MAERDLEQEIYQKIWLALEAYVPFTDEVPAGNRIRFDLTTGLHDPFKADSADGDFHEAVLWPRSGSDELHTSETTFGSFDGDAYACGANSEMSFEYRLEITSPYMGTTSISRTGAKARTALRKAGRTLGHDCVKGVALKWETSKEVRDETVRWTHVIDISVSCEEIVNKLM